MLTKLLSRLAGNIANSELSFIKTPLIEILRRKYNIDMDDAIIKDLSEYKSVNEFFTRKILPTSRPISPGSELASPADGIVVDLGRISTGNNIPAKGTNYSVKRLLGHKDGEEEKFYEGGNFMSIYLAPSDYHRVHCPISAIVTKITKVTGTFLPVHPRAVKANPDRYITNERLCFEFSICEKRYAVILIGSILVGSVISNISMDDEIKKINSGDEIGRFAFGSSVIIICSPDFWLFDSSIKKGTLIRMGQSLGAIQLN